jgi:FAD/FMN-containing dehydrogenase
MVQQAATESLKKHLRGQLLCQDDPGYNEARKIWNGMIDKRPALVARCSGAGDVVNSVKFACERDLTVAVRGGGHNIAGKCVAEGGFLIDLSGMKGVRVDLSRRTARAEAGVKLGELDR